ncbi:MAG: hypothetical protein P1V81_14685 [Planctomycetota bacterium]|nr:hypothetical protein [Planctomycetota bacterium]
MQSDDTQDEPSTAAGRAYLAVAALLALVVGLLFAGSVDSSRAWGWDESMHAGLPAAPIALPLDAGDLGEVAEVLHGCMQYPFVWPLAVGSAFALGRAASEAIEPGPVTGPLAQAGGAAEGAGQANDGGVGQADQAAGASDLGTRGLEHFGRRLGRWSMALMLFGLALLARECWRGTRSPWGLLLAPLLVLASPLVIDYSGTWFLEVPFAVVATFALWLWLRRARLLFAGTPVGPGAREGAPGAQGSAACTLGLDLGVGALVLLAFFTKFNYGLLLGLGLALDLLLDLVLVLRGRGPSLRSFGVATARLAALPALGFAWWFLLPLPLGSDIAAAHRAAFADFLGGNQQLVRSDDAVRLLHWVTSFVATPRLFVVVLVGLGLSAAFALRQLRCGCASARNQLRLWLVLLAMGVPIVTHNFHLDRFLVVLVPAAFVLTAAGWSALFAAAFGRLFGFDSPRARQVTILAAPLLVAAGLAFRSLDGLPAFEALVGFQEAPEVRDYQTRALGERWSTNAGRKLSTAGIDRVAFERLLDLVAGELEAREAELGRPATFAWLGISSELSPAALHIGVHERSGTPERLRRDAATVRPDGKPTMVVTFEGVDPGWNDDQLFAWAGSFDVVFTTTPNDVKQRRGRDFMRGYQERLIQSSLVVPVELGTGPGPPTRGPDRAGRLFSLRKP